jgi:hypothetical protein
VEAARWVLPEQLASVPQQVISIPVREAVLQDVAEQSVAGMMRPAAC